MLKDIHKKIVEEVLVEGIAKSHMSDIFTEKEQKLINNVIDFYNEVYLEDSHIIKRINLLASGNPIKDKYKWFEITQNELLKRGLNLNDGDVINVYLTDTLIDMAEYFHHAQPKLRNVFSYIHSQNPFNDELGSQSWHRDGEDFRIFKAFIYLNDIGPLNGALNYIKKSQFGGKWQSITDNIIGNNYGRGWPFYFKAPEEDVVIAEGEVGSIFFVNTHGLHKGGMVNEGIRCMLSGCYLNENAYTIVGEKSPEFVSFNKKGVTEVDYDSKEFKILSEKQKSVIS